MLKNVDKTSNSREVMWIHWKAFKKSLKTSKKVESLHAEQKRTKVIQLLKIQRNYETSINNRHNSTIFNAF